MRLLVAVAVLAITGEAFAAPPVLDGIEVVGTQATAVRLHLSAPAPAQARPLAPSGDAPDRIYVDLAGAILAPTLNRVVAASGSLIRVRAGQFDRGTVRVVLDLAAPVPFTIHQTAETVTIQLSARAGSARPETPVASGPGIATAPRPVEMARAIPPPVPAPPTPRKEIPPPAVVAPAEAKRTATTPAPAVAQPAPEHPATPPAPARVPAPAASVSSPVPPASDGMGPKADAAAPHSSDATDARHAGAVSGATTPAAVAPASRVETPVPPAARAEHRAPTDATPAIAEPAAAPTSQVAALPPPLPPAVPPLSPLPGALVELQNGRALGRPDAGSMPPAPVPEPQPAAVSPSPPPTALAAAEPVSPPERQSPAPSLVGPPSPPAAGPEPTKTTRAVPPRPPDDALARVVPLLAERPRPSPPAAAAPRRSAPRTPHPLIVLDAGHGGRDPGAEGVGGVLEKDVVLEIAQLVARRLAARLPVDVMMTRSDDSFIPIERRLALPGEGATLFISLHANACTDPTARGLEVFYGGGEVRTASTRGGNGPAALLGRCLDKALQARIGGVRGPARPGVFGVLVRNPVPSALIEIGYLTHPGEAARAQDAAFQELLADAVVEAVGTFLRASAPRL